MAYGYPFEIVIALAVKNLTKVYKNGVQALENVDLKVEEGNFFGLLGPNGAGKTTLIGIVCSLVNKTSGNVTVFDCDLGVHLEQAKSYLGVVPQEFNFNIFETVESILINQAGYYGIPRRKAKGRVQFYLQKLGLWEKRHSQSAQLSGGMKRRLMIARALIHEPKILVLDEPSAGVDIELRRSMWEFLKELNDRGTTIILTTHYLEEAESLCRNIAIIDHGKIIENTSTRELIQKLSMESFIFDLQDQISDAPELGGFSCRMKDKNTLEVDLHRGQKLNALFEQFQKLNIGITSMRNKSNRLEELFFRLLNHGK